MNRTSLLATSARQLRWGLVTAASCVFFCLPASAAVYNVDRADDSATASGCSDATTNDCSLRGAILAANASAGADTVNLPAGTYTLTIGASGDIAGIRGDLDIADALTIDGAGAATTIMQACPVNQKAAACPAGQGVDDAVVQLLTGAIATIRNVTIRHGRVGGGHGGGIQVDVSAQLTLQDAVVADNTAFISGGGGIAMEPGSTVTLERVTLTGNLAAGGGGGGLRSNQGTLTVTDSVITENQINSGGGGGLVDFGGILTLVNSTVSNNTASGGGGGISHTGSTTATITNSTISGNQEVTGNGGGGLLSGGGTLILTNSTVTGNQSIDLSPPSSNLGGGGVRLLAGTTYLNNVTITNNTTNGAVGGLRATNTIAVHVRNTIIAGNTDTGPVPAQPDCASALMTSGGFNLIGDGTGCVGFTNGVNGDQVGNALSPLDPRLAPLANNGGLTETHALCTATAVPHVSCPGASTAIDMGNPAGCTDQLGNSLTTDQRGRVRPRDGDTDGTATCDIGAFESAPAPSADLVPLITGIVPPAAQLGDPMTVNWQVNNTGTGSADPSTIRFFLSTDAILDAGDDPLGDDAVALVSGGGNQPGSTLLTIPAATTPGDYFILAQTDADGAVGETNELNNVASAPFTVNPPPLPDLVIENLTALPTAGLPGDVITVEDQTRNVGAGDAPGSMTSFYLSTDGILDPSDVSLGDRAVLPLPAGASQTVSTDLAIPAGTPPGAYVVLAQADGAVAITEADETNNVGSTSLTVDAAPPPDLVVGSLLVVPSSVNAGEMITVQEETTNTGAGDAPGSTTALYLSTDMALDPYDTLLGSRLVPALAAGDPANAGSTDVPIPAGTAPGDYFVLAKADDPDAIPESNETNNVASAPLTVTTPPVLPDLVVSNLVVLPSPALPGDVVTVEEATQNSGPGDAPDASLTTFYLSMDAALDPGDVLLANRVVPALAAGDPPSSAFTDFFIPDDTAPGNYFILAQADSANALTEADETNNVLSATLTVNAFPPAPPDLQISSLTRLGNFPFFAPGDQIAVIDETHNAGPGDAPGSTTTFYLSADTTLDPSDIFVGDRAVPALAAGASEAPFFPLDLTVPLTTPPGVYFILAKADGPGAIIETDETNNVTTAFGSLTVFLPKPDLVMRDLSISGAVVAPGGSVMMTDTVRNLGTASAGGSTVRYVLSSDLVLDEGDTFGFLGQRAVPELAPGGDEDTRTTTLTVPAAMPPGQYFILAQADGTLVVDEFNENNNIASVPVTVALPDLVITHLVILNPSLQTSDGPLNRSGDPITLEYTVRNQGAGPAIASTTSFALSGATGVFALDSQAIGPLAPGGEQTVTVTLNTPVVLVTLFQGNPYTIIAKADGPGQLAETDETNNVANTLILLALPDLKGEVRVMVTDPHIPEVRVRPGELLSIFQKVGNDSLVGARASSTEFSLRQQIGVDADGFPIFGPPIVVIGRAGVRALDRFPDQDANTTVHIVLDTPPGLYFLVARFDRDNNVPEWKEGNNETFDGGTPIRVLLRTDFPDLVVTDLQAPASAFRGGTMLVRDSTRNIGTLEVGGPTKTRFYLSLDGVVNAGDIAVGERSVPNLAAGQQHTQLNTILTIPAGIAPGQYALLAKADADSVVVERVEFNNTRPRSIDIRP